MKIKINVLPGTTDKVKTGNWRTGERPVIDIEKCIGCGTCYLVCPEGICLPSGKKNKAGRQFYICDLDYCKGCGLCAKECPVKAISMEREEK